MIDYNEKERVNPEEMLSDEQRMQQQDESAINFRGSSEKEDVAYLRDIHPIIEGTKNHYNQETLANLVEEPLLKACRNLYSKNIKTLMSSANSEDIKRGIVEIILDNDSLSEENKKIFSQLVVEGNANIVFDPTRGEGVNQHRIIITVNNDTTVQQIEEKSMEIVNLFLPQDKPINAYTIDEMREIYGISNMTVEDILQTGSWISYDEEKKLFHIELD